jgi:hypothetical protein
MHHPSGRRREFGNASKLKYVMNFLILIHNAATAEAMSFARKSGLDLTLVQSLVDDSFRKFQNLGPARKGDGRARLRNLALDLRHCT